ncbi:MAG: M17 family peptidase N-terminal domain-containing protein, partial [Chloroflexales bacterium]
MQITVQHGDILRAPADLAVLVTFEATPLPAEVAALLEAADYSGRFRQTTLLYPRNAVAPRRLLLIGLGTLAAVTPDALRQVAAIAAQRARELGVATFTISPQVGLALPPAVVAQAFAEGLALGAYSYNRYRTELSSEQTFTVAGATIFSADVAETLRGVATGQTVARAVAFARDLANGPGNVITPAALGQAALELGQRSALRVTVLEKPQLTEQGFGGILAVGQGSANEPRFIVIEHGAQAAGQPTLCLVGKGVTFDTGGISIKPADKMDEMKMDMGGAAAVFGAMQAVAELGLP